MSSQDTRAPFRQQRWLECKNVGVTILAPYSVAEVTGSTQPESATTTSVAMARTVLEIQQPTKVCEHIVIVGPKEIPYNDHGICTNDYPTFALLNLTDTYAVGTEVGVVAATQLLSTTGYGWIILGDITAGAVAGKKARVMRVQQPTLRGGCLDENHPGRGVVFDIHLGAWTPASDSWTYDTGTISKAIDWRYAVPYPNAGATGLFWPRPSTNYGTIWEVVALDCDSPGACGS